MKFLKIILLNMFAVASLLAGDRFTKHPRDWTVEDLQKEIHDKGASKPMLEYFTSYINFDKRKYFKERISGACILFNMNLEDSLLAATSEGNTGHIKTTTVCGKTKRFKQLWDKAKTEGYLLSKPERGVSETTDAGSGAGESPKSSFSRSESASSIDFSKKDLIKE